MGWVFGTVPDCVIASVFRQGTTSQVAEKINCAVILSVAKNLLVIQISHLQILRRLRLLRMTVLWGFFSNLFSRAVNAI